MKKIKILLIISVLLITVLMIWVVNISSKNDKSNNTKPDEESNIIVKHQKVTNPHMYFTVKACVEKYLYYLQQKDKDSICKILDYEYIKEFNIHNENVLQYVENISNPVILSVKEMYVLEKSENEHEYYISGILQEEIMDGVSEEKIDFIVTVKLDLENMIYSVIPKGYGGPLYEKE